MSGSQLHHPAEDSLFALVDGELGEQRAAVEAHLLHCARCAERVQQLELLRRTAAALPRTLSPPESCWEAVEARLHAEEAETVRPARRERRERADLGVSIPRWLAAASLLCTIGLVGAYVSTRGEASRQARLAARAVVTAPDAMDGSADRRNADGATERTAGDPMTEQLRILIVNRPGIVSPTVASDVAQSLRVLDVALERTEAALRSDPNNVQLEAMLERSRRQRAEFVNSTLALLADY